MKSSCDIFAVAAKCGVKLRSVEQRYAGPLRPRDCFCRRTLKRVGQQFGEGHLALTLRLIVETKGNADQLYQETITGIAALLDRHPQLIERGLKLFDDFDHIDLGRIRRHASALCIGGRMQETIAVLLALQLLAPPDAENQKEAA